MHTDIMALEEQMNLHLIHIEAAEERDRYRQTDKQTDKQTEAETETETVRVQTEIQRKREKHCEINKDREIVTKTGTKTEAGTGMSF